MNNIITGVFTIPRQELENLIKTLFLLGIAILVPSLIHVQWITGPIVNAILFLAVILAGSRNAILIGLIPSITALYFGLLPAPLAPMIPFIMISNVILIVLFDWLKKNFWLGVIVSACFKFLFLYFSYSTIMRLVLKKELATKISEMLSWPQFYTALLGGLLAWFVLKINQDKNVAKQR